MGEGDQVREHQARIASLYIVPHAKRPERKCLAARCEHQPPVRARWGELDVDVNRILGDKPGAGGVSAAGSINSFEARGSVRTDSCSLTFRALRWSREI